MGAFSDIGVTAVVRKVDDYLRDLGKMETANKDVAVNTDTLTSSASGLSAGIGILQTALASAAVAGLMRFGKAAAETVIEIARLGAEAARVEDAFRRVARGTGQSADAIIEAMDRATDKTVDDEDMMAVATKAMIMGLKLTADEWGRLAEGARQHARLVGMDTIEVFRGMVEAIERGQPRMLTGLGFAGARDAINEAAESLDGAASSMTEAERQGALLNLVMQSLNYEATTFGKIAGPDMVDQVAALGREWGDFKEEVGQGFLGTAVLETLTDFRLALDKLPTTEASKRQRSLNAETARWVAIGEAAGDSAVQLADGYIELSGAAWGAVPAIKAVAMASKNVLSPGLQDLLYQAKTGIGATVMGLVPEEVLFGLDAISAEKQRVLNEMITKQLKNLGYIRDEAEGIGEAFADSANEAGQAWDNLRSVVESVLQPTEVTAADMAATAAGTYVDKWDENIRRLNAIGERGFAELRAHTDWEDILSIPPDIMAGSEQQLKEWARRTADLRPAELLDVNKAVALVEQHMAQQAAHDAFVDMVAAAYAAKHGLGLKAGKTAVAGALGTPTEQTQTEIAGLPSKMGAWARGIVPQIEQSVKPIADAIYSGILKGIDTGWQAFIDKLTAQFGGLVNGIMNLLDAHSPSGVFMDIGRSMVAGLQKGMTAMPLMVTGGGAGAVTTNAYGGDTIVQNISDPVSFYLAQALVRDRKRDRWNTAMGVT